MDKTYKKICLICGRSFMAAVDWAKYDSKKCGWVAWAEKYRSQVKAGT